MQLIKQDNGKLYTLNAKELKVMISPIATKVLELLAKESMCPKDISKRLRLHEQKIYYHIHCLEKKGIIKVIKKEERGGVLAKMYGLTSPSFFVRFAELEETKKIPEQANTFLDPFIKNGKINAKIIVGSPDPHGPEKARSRDAYYAIDFALFLGTFISKSRPVVKLDTEISNHDLKENLILIGGPVVNRITKFVNKTLPIRFDEKKDIYSTITKRHYKSDDCGIIIKTQNPYNKDSFVLVIAGKRYSGTRAAVLSFMQKFDEISNKNQHVVEGIDADADGVVDDVKILE